MAPMERSEAILIGISVVSCLFSFSVVGTILFFKKMRQGSMMPIIMYMSLCDLLSNVVSALGFPPDGSVACYMQAIGSPFFTVSSWFWTTFLAYRVYCLIKFGHCDLSFPAMHAIAWIIPLIISVGPLTVGDVGGAQSTHVWCYYMTRPGIPVWVNTFMSYTGFFGWLFLCCGLMISWQVRISIEFRNSVMQDVIKKTYDKVYLYPIVMMICWSMNYWCTLLNTNADLRVNTLSMIIGVSNGIFSAIIFMVKSEEARKRWYFYYLNPKEGDMDALRAGSILRDFLCDFGEEKSIQTSANTSAISEVGRRSTELVNMAKSDFSEVDLERRSDSQIYEGRTFSTDSFTLPRTHSVNPMH